LATLLLLGRGLCGPAGGRRCGVGRSVGREAADRL